MSDQNPFEALFKQTQDWMASVNPALAAFNPATADKSWPTMPAEALEAFLGKSFNPQGLDAKTRLLLTLLGLVVTGAEAEGQIRLTVRHAIESGATPQEVAETIGLAALFGGVPAMQKGMSLAQEAIQDAAGQAGQADGGKG